MRRFGLSFLMAFALAATGYAGAAMLACPMNAGLEAAAPAHDCCPDDQKPANPAPEHQKGDCMMGTACRSASAVAPSAAPALMTAAILVLDQPIVGEAAPRAGPLQELWRPPRTI